MIQCNSRCGLLELVEPGLLYYPNGEAKNHISCLAIGVVKKAECIQNTHNEHIFQLSKVVLQFAHITLLPVSPEAMAYPNGEAKFVS